MEIFSLASNTWGPQIQVFLDIDGLTRSHAIPYKGTFLMVAGRSGTGGKRFILEYNKNNGTWSQRPEMLQTQVEYHRAILVK